MSVVSALLSAGALVTAASAWGRAGQRATVLVVLVVAVWLMARWLAHVDREDREDTKRWQRPTDQTPPPAPPTGAPHAFVDDVGGVDDIVQRRLVPAVADVRRSVEALGRAWNASVERTNGPAPAGYNQRCGRCGGLSGWLRVMACPHPPTSRERWRDHLAHWSH